MAVNILTGDSMTVSVLIGYGVAFNISVGDSVPVDIFIRDGAAVDIFIDDSVAIVPQPFMYESTPVVGQVLDAFFVTVKLVVPTGVEPAGMHFFSSDSGRSGINGRFCRRYSHVVGVGFPHLHPSLVVVFIGFIKTFSNFLVPLAPVAVVGSSRLARFTLALGLTNR